MATFKPLTFYEKRDSSYSLLPFRFTQFDENRYFLSNLVGEYALLDPEVLRAFINKQLPTSAEIYQQLRQKSFCVDELTSTNLDLLAIKLRSRYSMLSQFTGLHMMVVTLRCEHSCPYCQVSRQSLDTEKFDMSEVVADKALALIFQSPSTHIKIEFQGGEPLLNFPLIKYIVQRAKDSCPNDKTVSFVIATNLALISAEILDFCAVNDIHISTSLDGPEDLHNLNRPRPGGNSYALAVRGIQMARDRLGPHRVSALMTTTQASLGRVTSIIDEYLARGLGGIFLRPLSPHGFAIKTKTFYKYQTEQWIEFYKRGLDYVIQLNKKGILFTEFYATLILKKILTFQSTGYVDLMSPSGLGIAAAIYNYDGAVYGSDEGRMLAETGDETFKLGNVLEDSYQNIFLNESLLTILEDSYANSVPMCVDCAFEPYCGSDPVFHHATQGDVVGHKPTSQFCNKQMALIKHIIDLYESDAEVETIFRRWALSC